MYSILGKTRQNTFFKIAYVPTFIMPIIPNSIPKIPKIESVWMWPSVGTLQPYYLCLYENVVSTI